MAGKLKAKNKELLRYFLIWLILAFLIPKIIDKIYPDQLEFNFFSLSAFMFAVIIVFVVYNKDFLLKYKIKRETFETWVFSILTMIFMGMLIYVKFLLSTRQLVPLFHFSFLIQTFFVILLAFALLGLNLFRETFLSLVFSIAAAYVYFLLTNTLWNMWHFFSSNLTKMVHFLLGLFFNDTIYTLTGDPTLFAGGFEVVIGPPCSGIESLTLYLVLFSLMVILDFKRLNLKRVITIFLIGLVGIYFLNVIRIATLMIIGTKWPEFALGQFHTQAGWLLFAGFVLILYALSYKWMLNEKARKKLLKNK